MTDEFGNLRAVVTGGGSGIGLAAARLLANSGASVAVLDLDPAGAPDPLHRICCDIAETGSVEEAIAQAREALGGIDILVNNAGIGAVGTLEDNSEGEWLTLFNVNVLGVMRITRAVLPHLRRSSAAAVVNVGSVVAEVGLLQRALLTASKGALHALTRALAADYVADGIRVNSVIPGTVDTSAVCHIVDNSVDPVATRAVLVGRQPTGRLVSADEVASAICYLASPRSASTTGTSLIVDGGITGIQVARKR